QAQEPVGLLGRAEVGLGDDLEQRRAAAVEVDERVVGADAASGRTACVHCLGCVLLEMCARDPDDLVAVGGRHGDHAAPAERCLVLADLVALREGGGGGVLGAGNAGV